MKTNILIIGCGVSGLSCGIRLLETFSNETVQVHIVATEIPPNTTSDIAAAIWFPFKSAPVHRSLEWCKVTFKRFTELSSISKTGVSFVDFYELFSLPAEDPWWKEALTSFRHATPQELPQGYQDAYIAEVPLIETPIYMKYLVDQFKKLGGSIQLLSNPITNLQDYTKTYSHIINCTGLGAFSLCSDENVYPIRGQLVKTTAPGFRDCFTDDNGPLALTYIIPRSNDCILGGTAQEKNWERKIDPETTKQILEKSKKLQPLLEKVEVIDTLVGLRPGRTEIRLELDSDFFQSFETYLIHNYGHGGSGFTFSWGCAEEVLELFQTTHQ